MKKNVGYSEVTIEDVPVDPDDLAEGEEYILHKDLEPNPSEGDMAQVTDEYIDSMERIYRDILAAFPKIDPSRKKGHGLSFQSLYSGTDGAYDLGDIKAACEAMANGGAVEIKNGIFAHPTEMGEEIISKLTGHEAPSKVLKPFVPPTP